MGTRLLGPALTGSLHYEYVMAARRRVLWAATVPLLALAVLLAATSPAIQQDQSTSGQVGEWTTIINLLVTPGIAVALADRFMRTGRRGLTEVLDTTTAGPTLRMVGTLLGSLAAALTPVAIGMLAVGAYLAVERSHAAALSWVVVAFAVIIVPAALLLATFAATLALVVPVPLARVLALLTWGWATVWNTRFIPIPTITGTILSPLGDYGAAGWLHAPALHTDVDSLLSPAHSPTTAAISVAALLALALVLLLCARALSIPRG